MVHRFPLWDAPQREPSAATAFADNRLDRRSENRGDDDAVHALEDPAARLVLIERGQVWFQGARALHTVEETKSAGLDPAGAVLLGWSAEGPVLALAPGVEEPPADWEAVPLRSLYTQGRLPADLIGALAQGAALLNWHGANRFCARCGHESAPRGGGVKRVCPRCGAEHFPRTDPVAIMLALREDACLLGRSPHFAPGMFSALAGFIEPGETMENAVRRETFEESGIRIGRVAYHASQPWPFPHSLMLGCFGEALTQEVAHDTTELEACRWFGRAEVRSMLARTHPEGLAVPPEGAIAHHLIRHWAEWSG
ncbi:MAG: NAD(+) diphosphatase [Mesorhizobium amorphae]|nr:MAG: NAD(+) diphosphatase [Mesorhizobium amorphae]